MVAVRKKANIDPTESFSVIQSNFEKNSSFLLHPQYTIPETVVIQVKNLITKLSNSQLLQQKRIFPFSINRYFSTQILHNDNEKKEESSDDDDDLISNKNNKKDNSSDDDDLSSNENKREDESSEDDFFIDELLEELERKDEELRFMARKIGGLEFQIQHLNKNVEKNRSSLGFRNLIDDLLDEFAISLGELKKSKMIEKIEDQYKNDGKSLCIPKTIPVFYVRLMYHLTLNNCHKCQILREKIAKRGWCHEKFSFIVLKGKLKTNILVLRQNRDHVETIIRGLLEYGIIDPNLDNAIRDVSEALNSK